MKTFTTISPVDQRVYCEHPYASDALIAKTLNSAKRAQSHWQQTNVEQRATYCQKIIDYFNKHRETIAEQISWQMGRPLSQALGEITGLIERAETMIGLATTALAPLVLPKKKGFTRYICREPLGTILVLAPWNYPYLTAINSIIPA